jgi:hypothetical protein
MSKSKKAEQAPTRLDAEWTDYIINDLEESELYDGIPSAAGLRRMVEKHISPIVNIEVEITPIVGQFLTVAAVCKTTLANGECYSACSDANLWSAGEVFKFKLTALADTRAKSKCFREILRINNVLSLEEVNSTEDPDSDTFVTTTQVMALKKSCERIKADPELAMQYFLTDPPRELKKMKLNQCIELMGKIDDCVFKRMDIPNDILKNGE